MKNLLALFSALLLLCLFSCKKEKSEHQVDLLFKVPFTDGNYRVEKNGETYVAELPIGHDSLGGFTGYGIFEGDILTVTVNRSMGSSYPYSGEFVWTIKWNGPDRIVKMPFTFDSLECSVNAQIKIE